MAGELVAHVVTGGLIAHAVEPRSGAQAAAHHFEHGLCLNCGTALIDAHCHRCGQAGHVHRTAGAFFHDVLHGVFHFEGKAWRTLPMLVLHPGALTRRYVAGERARFVSPIALFLFSVFLMFAILAQLPMFHFGDSAFLKNGGGVAELQSRLGQERTKVITELTHLRGELVEERAASNPDASRIAKLERRIADAQSAVHDMGVAQRALPGVKLHSNLGSGFEGWMEQKWAHAKENPQLLLYKLKSSGYKYSWALIPLSLPFLWLLFPLSRRFGFYDHSVFATYSLTFMSLLTITAALLITLGAGSGWIIIATLIAAIVHIYKQLKGAYSLTRGGALVRTMLLTAFICWAIVPLFLTGLLYLGLAD